MVKNRSNRSKVRQLVVNGREVAKIIRNSGLNTRDFNCGYFFCNKRQMSKEVFKKRILDKIKDEDLRKRLRLFYDSNLIAIKISRIESRGILSTVDIETKSHNFLANGFVVHNSSQRFHRITEGLTKDFYKRIAEEMKKTFFHNKKLKGIIIGGPIPTKDEFVDGEYLATKLRERVIGKIDIGDASESGLEELVEKSQDLLATHERIQEKQEIEKLFKNLGEKPEQTFINEEDIRRALEAGAVETLYLSTEIPKAKAKELAKLAKDIGSDIKIISTENSEGEQFANLSGIAAILRFRV